MELIKNVLERTKRHHNTAFAAQIAFFFFLSLFPFIIVFITLAGNMLDVNEVQLAIQNMAGIPDQIRSLVLDFVTLANDQNISILSVSFIAILWSTSRAYYALSHAFGMAYGLKSSPNYFLERFKGLIYTSALVMALTIAMLLPAISEPLINWAMDMIEVPRVWTAVILGVKWTFYIIVLYGVLSVSFFFIPQRKRGYNMVWPGTVFTMVSWWLVANVFNLIVLRFTRFSLIYGTLATVAVMMLWLYTLANTMIIGAEINAVYREIVQKKDASYKEKKET